MTVPMKVIVDCETGFVSEVPLTDEEIAQREAGAAAWAQEQAQREAERAEREAKRQAALDKLAALGLTPEDLAAL